MFLRRLLFVVLCCIGAAVSVERVAAQGGDPRLIERLDDQQRAVYLRWYAARSQFNRQHEAYWAAVSARRAERRRKMAAGQRITSDEFVMSMPPKYTGPALRADIAKVQAELAPPPSPADEITSLPEMLAAAKQLYRFSPSLIPEREFKRRYAAEALAIGLSKEAVTRIYAFETGGRGTFDMQAGINPDTKAGRPISTAMGYAQLLAANSIDELTRSGEGFISRLSMMAARPGTPPQRVEELRRKIDAIRAMMRTARSVPKEWSRHVALARTPPGFAIHVLNLDGDVGPWLQVIKLKGILDIAQQAGLNSPTPAELEIMNLAGPKTGLEMMSPVGRHAPTANFFTQAAYYRNTIVREKTAAELLAAIDGRMNDSMQRPGSIEFVAAFEEVLRVGNQQARAEPQRQAVPVAARTVDVVAPAPVAVQMRPSAASTPAARSPVPNVPVVYGDALPVPSVGVRPTADASDAPLIVPAPVRAVQPAPRPRADWAPPAFRAQGSMPQGFPD